MTRRSDPIDFKPDQARLDGLHCLVLGGGGFLGTNLCRALSELGARVQAFGRTAPLSDAGGPKVPWTTGDFTDVAALAEVLQGQEVVFHLISGSVPESSNREPAGDLVANTVASLNLFELCRAKGVRKVVFTSSGGTVYGVPKSVPIPETAPTDPISAYGISKLATEKYLALYRYLHGTNYQVLRIANPYGRFQSPHKKQGVVAALVHRALSGLPLEIWGDGEVTRDFIHVDDVVSAMIHGAFYDGPHRVLNVGYGRGLSINQIVRDIQTVLDRGELPIVYKPGRSADVPVNILDTSLIQRETAWRPRVAWIDGLRDTVAWIEKQQSK